MLFGLTKQVWLMFEEVVLVDVDDCGSDVIDVVFEHEVITAFDETEIEVV